MAKSKHETEGERETEETVIEQAEAALPEGETDHANYVSKITVGNCGGNPGLAKTEKTRVPVMWIAGMATGNKVVVNPLGGDDFIALVGQFFAKNLQNGQEWRSGVCYLPGGYHENIVEAIEQQIARRELPDGDPQKRSKFEPVQVEFSMQFDAQPASNPSGYSYIAKSLLPIAKADPLAKLLDMSKRSGLLALPAPVRAAAD